MTAHKLLQSMCNLDQHYAACRVTVGVVDVLEVIHIEQHQAHARLVVAGARLGRQHGFLLSHERYPMPPIEGDGERIVGRQVTEHGIAVFQYTVAASRARHHLRQHALQGQSQGRRCPQALLPCARNHFCVAHTILKRETLDFVILAFG
jgi:hypothetical protein